jgi:hypothetical protein
MLAVEKAGDVRTKYLKEVSPPLAKLVHGVLPTDLYRYSISSQFDAPLIMNKGKPVLGDRVVNVSSNGIPFGLKGTVVSIHFHTKYVEVK